MKDLSEVKIHSDYYEKLALSILLQGDEKLTKQCFALGLEEESFFVSGLREVFNQLKKANEAGFVSVDGLEERFLTTGLISTTPKVGKPSIHVADWIEIRGLYQHSQQVRETIIALKNFAAVRRTLKLTDQLESLIQQGGVDPLTLVELTEIYTREASKKIGTEVKVKDTKASVQALEDFMVDSAANRQKTMTRTNIKAIDDIAGGFRNGELIIIAAETSGGKSALALQVGGEALRQKKPVLVSSLEMTVDTVMARLCSTLKQIPMRVLMNPKTATKDQLIEIKDWMEKMKTHADFFVVDEANLTMTDIWSRAVEQHEISPLGMVIVDYIQLVSPPKGFTGSREQEIAYTSRMLKQLAKKLDCPVLALSQLNETGQMRESRAIANDADIILKITNSGIAVAKYRSAPRGQILPVFLDGAYQTFRQAALA